MIYSLKPYFQGDSHADVVCGGGDSNLVSEI